MNGPPLVRAAERLLNPVLGKSLVVYMSSRTDPMSITDASR